MQIKEKSFQKKMYKNSNENPNIVGNMATGTNVTAASKEITSVLIAPNSTNKKTSIIKIRCFFFVCMFARVFYVPAVLQSTSFACLTTMTYINQREKRTQSNMNSIFFYFLFGTLTQNMWSNVRAHKFISN